jgi:hypothetical protein
MPEPPKPQPMAPQNTPLIKDPEMPTPPPAVVNQGEADAAKIKKRATKREQLQQSSSGANALRIPLNTGASASKSGSLNIPT